MQMRMGGGGGAQEGERQYAWQHAGWVPTDSETTLTQ